MYVSGTNWDLVTTLSDRPEIGAEDGLSDVGKDERPVQFAEAGVDRHHFRSVRGDGAAVCRKRRVTTSTRRGGKTLTSAPIYTRTRWLFSIPSVKQAALMTSRTCRY